MSGIATERNSSTEAAAATQRADQRMLVELMAQLEAVDITAIALMSKRSGRGGGRERLMSDMDHE